MSDGFRLAQMIRQAGQTPQSQVTDIVFGVVTSVDPIKVSIEGREIGTALLIVGPWCQETHIKMPNFSIVPHRHDVLTQTTTSDTHTHSVPTIGSTGSYTHTHQVPAHNTELENIEITDVILWRGLQVGDAVMMFKFARGQKYYIERRVEHLTGFDITDEPTAHSAVVDDAFVDLDTLGGE